MPVSGEFIANIANCPIGGEDVTHFDDGGWSRNVTRLKLGRAKATLVQHPALVGKPTTEFRGKALHTTDLVIENVAPNKAKWALSIAQDVCQLLSLATMSPVNVFGWHHGNRGQGWNGYGTIQYFRPTIDVRLGEEVRQFVETCWPQYRTLWSVRRLPAVIHYCVQAEQPGISIEYQLLGAFVMLESLKATFAQSRGIPFRRGRFFRSNSRPYTFEELLTLMFREVGMRPGLKRIVSVRNEIVHLGLSRRPLNRLSDYYDRVQDLAREYLLRILKFRGQYRSYSDPDRIRVMR